MSEWRRTTRNCPVGRSLADRHYNRQKIGAPGFVPPGRCLVLVTTDATALWVTSWPFAEYVRHAWPGAWIDSCFRREGGSVASDLIRRAVSHTLHRWPEPPALGMVTFVDHEHVPPIKRRGVTTYGYCYQRAGFEHVGFTKGGLWAWQLLPAAMPDPSPPFTEILEMQLNA